MTIVRSNRHCSAPDAGGLCGTELDPDTSTCPKHIIFATGLLAALRTITRRLLEDSFTRRVLKPAGGQNPPGVETVFEIDGSAGIDRDAETIQKIRQFLAWYTLPDHWEKLPTLELIDDHIVQAEARLRASDMAGDYVDDLERLILELVVLPGTISQRPRPQMGREALAVALARLYGGPITRPYSRPRAEHREGLRPAAVTIDEAHDLAGPGRRHRRHPRE